MIWQIMGRMSGGGEIVMSEVEEAEASLNMSGLGGFTNGSPLILHAPKPEPGA